MFLSINVLIKLRQSLVIDIKKSLNLAIISDNGDSLQNGISAVLQACLASQNVE